MEHKREPELFNPLCEIRNMVDIVQFSYKILSYKSFILRKLDRNNYCTNFQFD